MPDAGPGPLPTEGKLGLGLQARVVAQKKAPTVAAQTERRDRKVVAAVQALAAQKTMRSKPRGRRGGHRRVEKARVCAAALSSKRECPFPGTGRPTLIAKAQVGPWWASPSWVQERPRVPGHRAV